jgi:glyoxylase-like metal-dependent hydrolase (beta-lactamase superfamily II)
MAALADVKWLHGADCGKEPDPPLLQVHRFDADTFVMRENKCYSAEGNFMYLLLGTRRAILFDTGAAQDNELLPPAQLPIARKVRDILAERQQALDLVVAHTHSHGDHRAWDRQFPPEIVVKSKRKSIMEKFGLPDWPDSRAVFDLGERQLDVFPIPGHEKDHIAVYDRNTRILLTGDTLYPGVLTVEDWNEYRASADRLDRFVRENPVSLVLGAHIEMKNTPRKFYRPRTRFQPDEHALPLGVEHVRELKEACDRLGNEPRADIRADFVLDPNGEFL